MSYKVIRLSTVMPPAYAPVHHAIKDNTYTQFVIKGGRGGGKSSGVSEEVPLLLIRNPGIHAVVIRKVANTLRTTVYVQYVWALTQLGVYDKFKCTVSPMEITYRPTGQKIMFFGADDPGKIKSIKVPFGYIGVLHFEEVDQMAGEEEVRNIEQSVLRGGELAFEFKTFNPPRTAANWANKYCMRNKPGQLIHTMTYLDMPKDWLGQRFLDDAEHLKLTNPSAYEHEYLGVANGNGGNVFENVTARKITEQERKQFDRIYHGGDWGYYPDPFAFNSMHFDAARRTLYVFDEITMRKATNRQTADAILAKGITGADTLFMDSAEPKSVDDYRSYGIKARGALKGAGSVEYSIKWLQSLKEIVIDSDACPDTLTEFIEYEYERTRDGEVMSGYPDANNHHIDAVRYAMSPVWRHRGQ